MLDKKNVLNDFGRYNDYLFRSLEYDHFNLTLIYDKNLFINNSIINTIKIKHKTNSLSNLKETCVLGVLCNEKGLEIEKKMLSWLLPEYDVYCVYQKHPGLLYEYPALRFAQWISQTYNKALILYVHTKGAFHQSQIQTQIRELWKHEFTNPRKKIYIQLLKDNLTDISLPFTNGNETWFNGMLIANKAFNLIDEIKYNSKNRWFYESLFINKNNSFNKIRIKGVLNNFASGNIAVSETFYYSKYFKMAGKYKKQKNISIFFIILSFFIFIISLKIIFNFLKESLFK